MRDTATLGFIMSHACPLHCGFCNHTREEVGPGRISRDEIVRIIEAFASEPAVDTIAFSGGDPFLYAEDILSAMLQARDNGYRQRLEVITSGYWASEPGAVTALLRRFHRVGLSKLNLSYDREHARWVSAEQIMTICRSCAELGIPVDVYATHWDRDERLPDLIPGIEQWATVREFLVVPAGRAKQTQQQWPRHALDDSAKYSCGRPGRYQITVYPDGEVYPCCSGEFNKAAGLSCGNVKTHRPQQILENAFGHFHVRVAKELGWGALYEVVRQEDLELFKSLPQFADVDSPCEICRDLRRRFADQLRPYFDKMERVYATTLAELTVDANPTKDIKGLASLLERDAAARRRYLAGTLDQ